ncbi:hypothetical protein EES46_22905 [Streptomyces sp. ADI98-10]|nr:hypothetical protein EES46_22905 [Streptomyces sp. ADI98-10]
MAILVGVAAAFLSTTIGAGPGVADSQGIDRTDWPVQIGLAVVGVPALERVTSRRGHAAPGVERGRACGIQPQARSAFPADRSRQRMPVKSAPTTRVTAPAVASTSGFMATPGSREASTPACFSRPSGWTTVVFSAESGALPVPVMV